MRLNVFVLLTALLLATAPNPVNASPTLAFADALEIVCSALSHGGECALDDLERTSLDGELAHYALRLELGDGEHDAIRLHRIVREIVPGVPARTDRGMMLVHGSRIAFAGTFLTGADSGPDGALATYLARRGVDVWGIDLRWTQVPAGLPSYAFLADWNLDTEVEDLSTAMGVARVLRLLTGGGPQALHLFGYSRGGQVGYALVNREAAMPARGLRNVAGFIVGDIFLKSDDPALRAAACDAYAVASSRLAQGDLVNDTTFFNLLGDLAATAPDETSFLIPQLTNRQVALLIGFDGAPDGVVPFFHFVAGGVVMPFDFALRFTPEERWIELFGSGAGIQPLRADAELSAALCGASDLPWDDHLAEVEVPVLYVGAGGGIGEFGLYNLDLLGSDDITVHQVSFGGPRPEDFGHFDLLLAEDAASLAWEVVLSWIAAR